MKKNPDPSEQLSEVAQLGPRPGDQALGVSWRQKVEQNKTYPLCGWLNLGLGVGVGGGIN